MMRAAVCDGDEQNTGRVRQMAEEHPDVNQCDEFTDVRKLLLALESGEKYQIILINLEWDGKPEGMAAAERIRELDPDTRIVYMAEHADRYIQQIFLRPVNLSGFLMKPVDSELLTENIRKVAAEIQETDKSRLLVKYKSIMRSIRPEEILYLESAGHMVTIHTTTGKHSCYDQLEKLFERLPESFIQCHKSYIVNMDEIRRIERNRILLADDTEIPISKSRYSDARRRYSHYMAGLFAAE